VTEIWRELTVGDRVRIVTYPSDFYQPGYYVHAETAEVYRHLIAEKAILTVHRIDEFGSPWVEYCWTIEDGETEWHSLMVNHTGLERA
jgi:hypothetical protein